MVEKISAYKCEITGGVFEERQRAVKSEFRAMMSQIGGALPCWGSISPVEMMCWISTQIESGVYPTVADQLISALQWWKDNGGPTVTSPERQP